LEPGTAYNISLSIMILRFKPSPGAFPILKPKVSVASAKLGMGMAKSDEKINPMSIGTNGAECGWRTRHGAETQLGKLEC
jgi:hypothetical protein